MNQDPINPNYNPQNVPNQYNPTDGMQNKYQPNPATINPIHFSPSNVDLDALNTKSQLDNLMHSPHQQSLSNEFQQQDYNSQQFQPSEQFGSYNPYQNTGSNIQNFAPQDNFDTGFNPNFNPTQEFNQNGIDQYKSSTPQFNPNDPYLMPSTNPELDDLDEAEDAGIAKPQKDTKKILMFGLIGLIVVLLVASLALFFLTQNKGATTPANTNTTSSKPAVVPANDKTTETPKPVDSTIETGGPDTPAGKSIVNPGATTIPAEWLSANFTATKGALAADGTCKLQAVCGPKSDPDKDGLGNLKEFIFGTTPTVNDTDKDGISDKDELFVYHTDPKIADTNNNTYSDSVEINNCYDPNIPSQKFTKTRLNEISSSINKPFVNGLSEPTITTLKEAGAKAGELEKGFMSKCAVTTTPDAAMSKEKSTPKTSPTPQDTNTNEGA
jgi:flagellar basal body-associated protein FliL